jgi:hypothetical protein
MKTLVVDRERFKAIKETVSDGQFIKFPLRDVEHLCFFYLTINSTPDTIKIGIWSNRINTPFTLSRI